eukprot:scaffold187145_cov19-Tisochrysis_lutea.AAC.1
MVDPVRRVDPQAAPARPLTRLPMPPHGAGAAHRARALPTACAARRDDPRPLQADHMAQLAAGDGRAARLRPWCRSARHALLVRPVRLRSGVPDAGGRDRDGLREQACASRRSFCQQHRDPDVPSRRYGARAGLLQCAADGGRPDAAACTATPAPLAAAAAAGSGRGQRGRAQRARCRRLGRQLHVPRRARLPRWR